MDTLDTGRVVVCSLERSSASNHLDFFKLCDEISLRPREFQRIVSDTFETIRRIIEYMLFVECEQDKCKNCPLGLEA
jgi:hypothetical protein